MTCIATAPVSPRRAYLYDTLGRPTSRALARQGASRNDVFNYNDRSELISDVVDGTGLNGWDYDRAAAACSSGVANRPVLFSKVGASLTVACTYDYMGRRATKVVTENGVITTSHRFLYRGYLQIACCDRTRANHPCLWLITWDPTQPIATRPLAIQKDSTWYTYGWDLTKNIWEAYTTTGYIGTAYTYTAYGQVTASGTVEQPIQWSSEYNDTELALVYYNYRYYNSIRGRWQTQDPLKNKRDCNLYIYTNNNPLTLVDILGQVVNSASDVNIAPKFAGGTIQEALDTAINEFQKQKKCCIETLVWILHGANPEFMIMGASNRNIKEYNNSKNLKEATVIDMKNAKSIASAFTKNLTFCQSCKIYFLACNTGVKPGGIPQIFANETGCKVYAPRGYCYPNYKNPEMSRITSKYKDTKNEIFPVHEGAKDGEFREYIPNKKNI